jgi:hypothetical protein
MAKAKATRCRIKRLKTGGTRCMCPNRRGQMRFAKKGRCK